MAAQPFWKTGCLACLAKKTSGTPSQAVNLSHPCWHSLIVAPLHAAQSAPKAQSGIAFPGKDRGTESHDISSKPQLLCATAQLVSAFFGPGLTSLCKCPLQSKT